MAEIGVLELEIRDNSKDAGTGLRSLATALERVQAAVGGANGFGLAKVGNAVTDLAKKINEAKGTSTVVKNLASLFNSISNFKKISSDFKINTKPFEDLKAALGDGFKIGNAGTQLNKLRESMTGAWGDGSAITNIRGIADAANALDSNGTASKLSAVATALSALAKANKEIGTKSAITDMVRSASMSTGSVYNGRFGADGATADLPKLPGRLGISLQNWGGIVDEAESQFTNFESRISESIDTLYNLESAASNATGSTSELASNINEIGDSAQGIQLEQYLTDPLTSLMDRVTNVGAIGPVFRDAFDGIRTAAESTDGSLEDMRSQIDALFYTGAGAEGFGSQTSTAIDRVDQAAKQADISLQRMKQQISDLFDFDSNFSQFIYNAGWFGSSAPRLMAGHQGNTAQENMLSIYNPNYSPWDWKPDFIMGEGTVSGDETRVFNNLREVADNMGVSVREAKKAIEDILKTANKESNGVKVFSSLEEAARAAGKTVEEMTNEINANLGKLGSNSNKSFSEHAQDLIEKHQQERIASIREHMGNASEDVKNVIAHNLGMGADELFGSTTEASGGMRSLGEAEEEASRKSDELTGSLKEVDRELKNKKSDSLGARAGLSKFGEGIKKMFPTLTGLIKRFGAIAKYRALRAVLRHITQGISEGLENLKKYGEATGSSYYNEMQDMSATLLTMKNSIGAAIAPALQAAIPILQAITRFAIQAFNALNQLISLLTGKTSWTRATEATADSLNDVKKAAGGAGSAMKDLLADWDELNIIQSESGGGGGGSGSTDLSAYENMFEEVNEFDQKIRDITNFLKDNFSTIETLAIAIGTAILGWKVSSAFSELLPLLSKIGLGLTTLATVVISLTLTDLFGKAYVSNGGAGWLIADALTGALGPYIAGKLATKLIGASGGTVVAGFTLVLEGAVNIKNAKSAMDEGKEGYAWALGALGSIETGIGFALIAKGLGLVTTTGGLFAAGTMGAVLTLGITALVLVDAKNAATYRKMAFDAFRQAGDGGISVEDYLTELQKRFDELTEGSQLVLDAYVGFDESGENFKSSVRELKNFTRWITSGKALTEAQAEEFRKAWEIVFNELDRLGTITYETIFAGLDEAMKNGTEEIRNAAAELQMAEIEIAKLTGGARAAAQEEMGQILNEIAMGDSTRLDRYLELYKIWGEDSEESQKIDKYVNDAIAERISFSAEGNPAEEARSFLTHITDDMVRPALDLAAQEYAAEMSAIDYQRSELERAKESGYITADDYNNSIAALDRIADLLELRYEEQQDQIIGAADNAYDIIADELYRGYMNLEDPIARQHYIDEMVNPVMKVFEEAGREIPDTIKQIQDLGTAAGSASENLRNQDFADLYGRDALYAILYGQADAQGASSTEEYINIILSGEGLNLQGNYENLTVADQADIVNALLPLFSEFEAPRIIDYLASTYGFDRQAMLSGINYNALQGRKYMMNGEEFTYEINDLIEALHEYVDDFNYNNPNNPLNVLPSGFATSTGIALTSGILSAISMIPERGVAVDEENVSNGVQKGTSEGFSNLSTQLSTANSLLRQLLAKDNVAKLVPTSAIGKGLTDALAAFGNVTGNG